MSNVVPIFQILTMPLTNAQLVPLEFRGKWNYLRFFDCRDINGNQALTGTVNVLPGHRQTDPLPMGLNGLLTGDTESWQFSWPAQPGLTAYFLASRLDDAGNGVKIEAPPSRQLVSSAVGLVVVASRVNVTNVATLISAGNVTRQRVTLRNRDLSNALYVGGAGVTVATGFQVDPNESVSLDGQTAAVFAISNVAGGIRADVLVEQ